MKRSLQRLAYTLQALLLIAAPVMVHTRRAFAAELTFRSVAVSSALPSVVVAESFSFSIPTTASIGSIEFEHCSNNPLVGQPCTAPSGYDATTTSLVSQTNNTGFSIDSLDSTANRIVITRIPSAGALGTTTFSFTGITSPNVSGTTFVRIATFASIDGSGARSDAGSVAFATLSSFSVGAFVPPFLIFCAAVTVALNCSSVTGVLMSFGEMGSTITKTATSQFSGATNDYGGYSVFLYGQTMTAGNQSIPPLTNTSSSVVGTGQFGINLMANTNPVVGANVSGPGTTNPAVNYNVPDQFRFVSGELLASSSISTDYNVHTVSYIVNIANGQPPGYYATTLTYVAIAAF